MMQVSSKAGEQQHSAAPQIEHQRRRECSPQVFCSILTRSLGTLTVTREIAGPWLIVSMQLRTVKYYIMQYRAVPHRVI